jgi:hypothetical protein
LVHAEGHLRAGEDFDRRIALISFDNAIEITIATYLSLNPIQRGNRQYPTTDVNKWLTNYHAKLEFLDYEISVRKSVWAIDKSHIIYCHDHRNEQYHGGIRGVPEKQIIEIIRQAALWVFSMLFDIPDAEERLAQAIAERLPPSPPERDPICDHAIDGAFEPIDVGGQAYSASEILFSVDYEAYRDLGAELSEAPTDVRESVNERRHIH